MESWLRPDDKTYVLQCTGCMEQFTRLVLDSVDMYYWRQAAQHHCGAGLEQGVHTDSFKLHAALLRQSDSPSDIGMIECILTGAVWTPVRMAAAYPDAPVECPRCNRQAVCDDFHLFLNA